MDEQLRAKPDDLVALVRAGRLDPKRVAMAAYLGDERALATGVQPWEPPAGAEGSWPAVVALSRGPLSRRERVWLACLCAERSVVTHWTGGRREPEEALRVARAWCRGGEDTALVSAAAVSAYDLWDKVTLHSLGQVYQPGPAAVRNAAFAAQMALPADDSNSDNDVREALSPPHGKHVHALAEQAWQAQAIANVLLDPDGFPWEE